MEKSSPAPRATEGALPKLHLKEEDVIINYNLDYYQILGLEDLEHSRITEEVVHKTFNALSMHPTSYKHAILLKLNRHAPLPRW